MDPNTNILLWNMRGPNDKSHRDTLRSVVADSKTTVVCLQETKLDVIPQRLIYEMLGSEFRGF